MRVNPNLAKTLYRIVGLLGMVVGAAYLFKRQYLFGAVYFLFGVIWMVKAAMKPRERFAANPALLTESRATDLESTSATNNATRPAVTPRQ